MNTKTILVVEDEDRMIALMKEALEDWNDANIDSGRCFKAVPVNSIAGASEVIYDLKVDCAMVDLRLPTDQVGKQTSPESGNALANDLILKKGMPVAIVSGYPAEMEDHLTGLPVNRFDKADDGYEQALNWLGEQWTLMEALRSVRNVLELSTGEVFARRIWPNWSQMVGAIGIDGEKLATAIARQYASHTAELLGQEAAGDWHPFENFVLPSYIADRAHTGDIFVLDDTKWIVLTPQCDMATGKAPNVLLAACSVGDENWKRNIDALKAAESQSKIEKANKYFRKFVNQNLPASDHFLPPIPGTEDPILVNFTTVRTIPLEELNQQLANRVASVSPPFLSNLVQRFGAFISRTGQPNIDVEHF
ncbi:response regulator [uncultured Roseovarius sp.]|uniref:response regulator n=1 Tax=uncultured Roseovarius sp. TaxID=293344 RepID=UPI0025DBF12C|nr:response regulator [uncultured Roseovarius sp.]